MSTTNLASFEKLQRARNRNFVCPELCQQLFVKGITTEKPLYNWFIINDGIAIRTTINTRGQHQHEGGATWSNDIIASSSCEAYTTADLDAVLPPYCVTKNAFGQYEVMIDQDYSVGKSYSSDRLPDALAAALLHLLDERKITAEYAKNVLNAIRIR